MPNLQRSTECWGCRACSPPSPNTGIIPGAHAHGVASIVPTQDVQLTIHPKIQRPAGSNQTGYALRNNTKVVGGGGGRKGVRTHQYAHTHTLTEINNCYAMD